MMPTHDESIWSPYEYDEVIFDDFASLTDEQKVNRLIESFIELKSRLNYSSAIWAIPATIENEPLARIAHICKSELLAARWHKRVHHLARTTPMNVMTAYEVVLDALLSGRTPIDPWDGTGMRLPHLLVKHKTEHEFFQQKEPKSRRKTRV